MIRTFHLSLNMNDQQSFPAVLIPDPAVQNPDPAVQNPNPAVQNPDPAVQNPDPAVQNPFQVVQNRYPAVVQVQMNPDICHLKIFQTLLNLKTHRKISMR